MGKNLINFAERVTISGKTKTTATGSNSGQIELSKKINEHKVSIDYSTFEKTDAERDMLKHMKKQFKTNPGFHADKKK